MRDIATQTCGFGPFTTIAGKLDGGVLLLCDHASAALPEGYGALGLTPDHFTRHIAYDIGAADLTRGLARRLGAPALMTTYSRLLIDPNRGADDPTLVMRISDRALIPGNARIDATEIETRRRDYWQPYRNAIDATIDAMQEAGPPPAVISIHSFTPIWRGHPRPWHVGVLWDCDDRLARPFLDALAQDPDLVAGDNEPYDGALQGDTMFDHGTLRGLAHMLVEVRQDLIDTPERAEAWAGKLAPMLRLSLAAPEAHMIRHYPSRAASEARLQALRQRRIGETRA
jgi:predicted N-formylglutamate amidohydrolase